MCHEFPEPQIVNRRHSTRLSFRVALARCFRGRGAEPLTAIAGPVVIDEARAPHVHVEAHRQPRCRSGDSFFDIEFD
jgi:hypothetical protein